MATLLRPLSVTASTEGDPVTTLELFFDLVYVFAFTQVTTLMAHGEAPGSLLDGFIVLSLLWWSWCSYAWLANQAHADEGLIKGTFIVAMTAMFLACLALPDAFHDTHSAVIVVACYAVVRLTHVGTYLIAARGDPKLRRQVLVTLFAALLPTVALLIAGAFGDQRVLWLIAVLYDFAAVFITASRAGGWVIQSAAHFSERHGLIVILALGESIVAIAAGLEDPHVTWRIAVGAVLSLLVSVGLYFAYFAHLAERLETALDELEGVPRATLGAHAFTYLHFPIIAGIVLAALGVEHAMGHLGEHDLGALGGWALCGGVALFLAATVATLLRCTGEWSRPRAAAIVLLLALAAVLAVGASAARHRRGGRDRPRARRPGIREKGSAMTTWLITGCSTGLGRALAGAVLAQGQNAVVTARDPAKLADLVDAHPDTALAAALDVTDPADVKAAVEAATARFGGVDVLVNNAGYGYRSAVEEGDVEDVATLFATNFFGPIELIKAVLPGMRERRSGAIVNLSSIAARITPEGSGYYAAVKAAVEGLSGSMRRELQPLGISVTVVEPGMFRTDFAGRSLTQSRNPIADYAETAGQRRIENDDAHGTQPGDPEKAAQAIITAVESEEPPLLLLLGEDAYKYFWMVDEMQRAEVERWQAVSVNTGF